MATVSKSSGVGGKWLDKKTLKMGDQAKIKTEAIEQVSQQSGKPQLVAKLQIKGQAEAANFAINTPSKNALIDAFGTDTLNWIDKLLTLYVMPALISGKMGMAVYLVPEGFEVKADSEGYMKVVKIGKPMEAEPTSNDYSQEEVDPNDIPF